METSVRTGRLAGLYWLLSAVAGGYGLSFVRGSVIVAGDAAASAANVASDEFGYRVAIVCTLVGQVLMVFFAVAIYRLFRETYRPLAIVFLVSVLMSVTIAIVNTFNHFGALLVVSNAEYMKAFSTEQLQAMAMMFLRMSNTGQGLLEVFWVPYNAAFGLLFLRSGRLPKYCGVMMIAMSVGFAVNLLDKFLVPQFHPALFTQIAMALGALGGIPTILWLVIKGVREDGHGSNGSYG